MAESEFGHKVDEKPLSNGIEEEPDFSDPEDFVDEIDEQGNTGFYRLLHVANTVEFVSLF